MNVKSVVIGVCIFLIIIFTMYQIILLSQPNCYIYANKITSDQINFEKDIIIHLNGEDFNKHPVLKEIITGEKPISRILILDPRGVNCKEQNLIKNKYCQNDPFSEDYKILVEWNDSYYELYCAIS